MGSSSLSRKRRLPHLLAYLIGVLLVWALAGCGGSGDSATGGHVALSINWPARPPSTSRYLPSYANSLEFSLSLAGGQPLTLTVNRPATLPLIQTVEFQGPIPAGTYVLTGTAKTGLDGTGDTVASATENVEVQPTGITTVGLTLASTLYSLDLLDMPLNLQVGDAKQLRIQVLDKNKNSVFVPTTALTWAVVIGKSSVQVDESGTVTAVAVGKARIRVSEVGAGLYSDGDITVAAPGGSVNLAKKAPQR